MTACQRKPKPIPHLETADPERRFNSTLPALPDVKKTELLQIEAVLNSLKNGRLFRKY